MQGISGKVLHWSGLGTSHCTSTRPPDRKRSEELGVRIIAVHSPYIGKFSCILNRRDLHPLRPVNSVVDDYAAPVPAQRRRTARRPYTHFPTQRYVEHSAIANRKSTPLLVYTELRMSFLICDCDALHDYETNSIHP